MNYEDTIAVISDLHGNLFALTAILEELKNQRIRHILIAGDHIGDGPQPKEIIDIIRSSNAYVIKGNREDYLLDYLNGKHPDWTDAYQMKALVWNQTQLSDNDIAWMRTLSKQCVLQCHDTSIRMVHGSPRRINELIHRDDTELIKEALASVDEDILICGHCHQQWHTTINSTLIVNPGAAGLPFMPPGSAPYTLLHHKNHTWTVEERCAHYDLNAYLSTFDKEYIHCGAWVRAVIASLKSGNVVTLQFLKYATALGHTKGWNGKGLIPNLIWEEADQSFHWHEYM